MKKTVLALVSTCVGLAATAQTIPRIQEADPNDVRGAVQATGHLWWDFTDSQFEVPKRTNAAQSKRSTVFTANLWLGGQDANGQVYVAAETYRQGVPVNLGFTAGPIAANYAGHVPLYGNPAFDHVWKITRAEVQDFRQHYAQPGYQLPAAIAQWPAPGNASGGAAPFIDVGADGQYDPASGDYPDFPGDQALYFVINDEAQIKEPFSPAFGMEVQGFVYSFNPGSGDPALDKTVFVRYTLFNRSSRAYHDAYFGHWVDFDLGNPWDDYIGCDRARRAIYAYNGDAFDQDTVTRIGNTTYPITGYGANPPAQAVVLLNDSLAGFSYYYLDFSPMGIPQTANDYYNYLRGRWRDGVPFTTGGDGRNGGGVPTTHLFDGNPVTGTGWTEQNAGNAPGDRRGLLTAGPFSLPAGGQKEFQLAYVFAQGAGGGSNPHLTSVAALQVSVDAIRRSYAVLSTPNEQSPPSRELAIFPNPAHHTATVRVTLPTTTNATLTLHDALGRLVRAFPVAGGENQGLSTCTG